MGDLDEDAPPALSKLASQVAALTCKSQVAESDGIQVTATVTPKYTASTKPAPLKAGFFDAPRPQRRQQSSKEKTAAAIPHIKAKQGPAVPDKFLIPPDEQDKQYAAMKKKLADDLMPTQDTIRQIAGNQSLLAGFDDPEVMQAVSDVAQNPANIQKYQHNKKVQAFYQQMGSVMAARCDELGAAQDQLHSNRSGQSSAPQASAKYTAAAQRSVRTQQQRQSSCKIEEIM